MIEYKDSGQVERETNQTDRQSLTKLKVKFIKNSEKYKVYILNNRQHTKSMHAMYNLKKKLCVVKLIINFYFN